MTTCKKPVALLWLAILALALTACTKHKPVPPPDVNLNPAPKVRNNITLLILEDPADIVQIQAKINYTISNRKCVPVDLERSFGGSRPIFREGFSIPIIHEHANEYSGFVYADALIDENYYGLGICHWKIDGIGIEINRGSTTNIATVPIGIEKELQACSMKGYASDGKVGVCTPISTFNHTGNIEYNQSYRILISTKEVTL